MYSLQYAAIVICCVLNTLPDRLLPAQIQARLQRGDTHGRKNSWPTPCSTFHIPILSSSKTKDSLNLHGRFLVFRSQGPAFRCQGSTLERRHGGAIRNPALPCQTGSWDGYVIRILTIQCSTFVSPEQSSSRRDPWISSVTFRHSRNEERAECRCRQQGNSGAAF